MLEPWETPTVNPPRPDAISRAPECEPRRVCPCPSPSSRHSVRRIGHPALAAVAQSYPKQFVTLLGETTLYQASVARAGPGSGARRHHRHQCRFPLHRDRAAAAIGIDPGPVLIEPDGRNTAPAVLAAALMAPDPEAAAAGRALGPRGARSGRLPRRRGARAGAGRGGRPGDLRDHARPARDRLWLSALAAPPDGRPPPRCR